MRPPRVKAAIRPAKTVGRQSHSSVRHHDLALKSRCLLPREIADLPRLRKRRTLGTQGDAQRGATMASGNTATIKAWASAIFLLLALVLFGLFFGALVATRIFPTSRMGWDQLADFLGGAMLGGIAGLVAALALIARIAPRARMAMALVALMGCAGAMAYMSVIPAKIRRANPVAMAPVVEPFSLTLAANDSTASDGTQSLRPADAAMPWNTLRMGSNLAFDYILQTTPRRLCVVPGALQSEAGIAAAKDLRTILQALPGELSCAPPCPNCAAISLEYYLGQKRSTLSFDSTCWRNEPALQPLHSAITSITTKYDKGERICETAP